jgi:hypothetical protein
MDGFKSFEAQLRAQGFDEVLEKDYPPRSVIDTHSHAFAAKAMIVGGEMWLTVAGHTQHIMVGGTFELASNMQHSERHGDAGATYWVGRRRAG